MKKGLTFLFAIIVGVSTLSARATKLSDASALPDEALTTIETFYGNVGVDQVKVDSKAMGKKNYDVVLSNGTAIEFDNSGCLKEINCGKSEVPAALVIQPIRDFVKKNFEEHVITGIEFKKNGYDVELSNGVDIRFDQTGKFRRIN